MLQSLLHPWQTPPGLRRRTGAAACQTWSPALARAPTSRLIAALQFLQRTWGHPWPTTRFGAPFCWEQIRYRPGSPRGRR